MPGTSCPGVKPGFTSPGTRLARSNKVNPGKNHLRTEVLDDMAHLRGKNFYLFLLARSQVALGNEIFSRFNLEGQRFPSATWEPEDLPAKSP
jgi:hypothetical protein